ncbi:MAG: hypothetical protein JJ913_07950 [Rhizobiaceae bacterium]|nr:hypothetical protein [Rhizobiaceae bacterium]
MQRLDSGFAIGSRRYAWGTTFEQFVAETAPEGRQRSAHSLVLRCDSALGIAAISAEVTAPRADRPILQLCYQLAPVAGDPMPAPDQLMRRLSEAFGVPDSSSNYELPGSGDPSGSVRYYAGWNSGAFGIGLSLYGAPRETEFGVAPGCLWLSWSPVMAARPYLADWRDRAEELARRQPTDMTGFRFGLEQQPVFGTGGSSGTREANYVLYHPELLPTPPSVAALAGEGGAVFWRGGEDWCASTAWDTVMLAEAQGHIAWNDVAPAKGGGFSEISIGRWAVRDRHGSRPIRDAAEHLARTLGVSINHNTGYDC